jgi:hypothetical protein
LWKNPFLDAPIVRGAEQNQCLNVRGGCLKDPLHF